MATIKANDAEAIEAIFHEIVDKWNECGDIEIEFNPVKKRRSNKQNKAMRKGWTIGTQKLNAAGWSQNDVFKIRQSDILWSDGAFEHSLWRPVQAAYGFPQSTADLSPGDFSKIWDTIRDHLIKGTTESELGPTVDIGPFPSIESLSESQR